MSNKLETAVFGGGCFWCTEAVFQNLRGVVSVLPGYAGGRVPNPTYEQVSSGMTGHVEVSKIEFNPDQITFHDLLEVFFATHDPTTQDRQGNDVGEQYRSVVFYVNDRQRAEAENVIRQLQASKAFNAPIVTQVQPLNAFYQAEDYHQQYYSRNQDKPYCRLVIDPKLAKFRAQFAKKLK